VQGFDQLGSIKRKTGMKTFAVYTKNQLDYIKRQAMKTTGAKAVKHIVPRAYCNAKLSDGCAVFATPWQDEQARFRNPVLGSCSIVNHGSDKIAVGDWASIATVQTVHDVIAVAVPIPYAKSDVRGWK
jgi:hypothetical protein